MTKFLSRNETAALLAIEASGGATGRDMSRKMRDEYSIDTSPAGAHQTAASLVRKGLASRAGTSKQQWYKLTQGGIEVLAGRHWAWKKRPMWSRSEMRQAPPARIYTDEEMAELMKEHAGASGEVMMLGWLARGDGIAVYRNEDLGHPEVGHIQFASYGSKRAMLETGQVHVRNDSADGKAVERAQAQMSLWASRGWGVSPVPVDGREHPTGKPCPVCSQPPQRLPDIGGAINWRYQLAGVYGPLTPEGSEAK